MRVGFICSSRKCESPETVPIFDVAAFMADGRRGRRAAARDRERRGPRVDYGARGPRVVADDRHARLDKATTYPTSPATLA